MDLKRLALAGAATLLMTGAARAQLGTSATPNTGVATNRPTPAPVQPGTTGIPSPDSTRLTGSDAGKTNLPGGQLSGGTGASTAFAPLPAPPVAQAPPPPPAVAQAPPPPPVAPAATEAATTASAREMLTTNGPVPDTPENRRKYGGPMSHAGKRTAAKGN